MSVEIQEGSSAANASKFLSEVTSSLLEDIDGLGRAERATARSLLMSIGYMALGFSLAMSVYLGSSALVDYSLGDRFYNFGLPLAVVSFGAGVFTSIFSLLQYQSLRHEVLDLKLKVAHKADMLKQVAGMVRREQDRVSTSSPAADLVIEFRLLEAEAAVKRAGLLVRNRRPS